MDGWMDGWMDEWMGGWVGGWVGGTHSWNASQWAGVSGNLKNRALKTSKRGREERNTATQNDWNRREMRPVNAPTRKHM